ncbi:MAG: hypothetical protein P4L20_15375 [Acidimicrobiales bacterium]|nr:hypothetical protein [Acidimicrobiales bacterium]
MEVLLIRCVVAVTASSAELQPQTAVLIREQVASINTCLFCMDASRWYALKVSSDNAARFDALAEYHTSPLFTDAERAALDYATELTSNKQVTANTFSRSPATTASGRSVTSCGSSRASISTT